MPIPEEIINQIKDRAEIRQVIGEYVQLRKAGQNYKGLCPFHTEKTPSFIVSPQKGIYHCFGCGAGGNVFRFIMQFKGLSFPEAVRFLGEKVGVSVVSQGQKQEKQSRSTVLREVIKASMNYYRQTLRSSAGQRALEYLKGRNISEDILEDFNIGFARDSWDSLMIHLREAGYQPSIMEEAGLIIRRKSGTGYYDRFRNRIMFPIQDSVGRFIGFGGRTLGPEGDKGHEQARVPKYINTSENPIFHKGKSLYGFAQAEEHIRKKNHVYVVEGYIDVMGLHEQGLRNTVAPLGTALTEDHVAHILRYTRNIFFIFDPDEAGMQAAMRSTSILHRHGIDPFIIRLPFGHDPGDFFDSYSLDDFLLLKNEALTGIDFIIIQNAGSKKSYTAHEKMSIIESLADYYNNMRDEIFREDLLHRLANVLGTEKSILKQELQKRAGSVRHTKGGPSEADGNQRGSPYRGTHTELYLLLLLLSNPEYHELAAPRLDESYFHGKWTKKLWQAIQRAAYTEHWDSSTVLNFIEDEQFIKYLSGKLLEEKLTHNPKEQLIDTIATLKEIRLREKLAQMNRELRKAELENDEARETELLVEINAFSNELKKIDQLRTSKVRL
jgi:DNA primase